MTGKPAQGTTGRGRRVPSPPACGRPARGSGSELSGPDRHGAPSDHNVDTLEAILDEADHVDTYAAAGPDADNTFMPREGASPQAARWARASASSVRSMSSSSVAQFEIETRRAATPRHTVAVG